ncbi:MAG: threonine--tRNA ligase, partial [Firmicutes bacterium]|nr:threonine--tRNA ligase [Bacillota bacterium]
SGVLHGMLRVRGFTQDDAHLFMRPDQLEEEIIGVIDLVKFMMEAFQYKEYEFELSVRDPNRKQEYAGSDDIWDLAENALISAMNKAGIEFRRMEGEAKFYGPAIDVHIKDALGRGWQGPTIQVDFNLPQRFGLYYIGEDNAQHQPVMIHRTVLGSMERFVAGLIEHYNGAFPVWLAPSQVRIIPIADRHIEYAKRVEKAFRDLNLRVETDARPEKVGYKIREAQLEKVPYMIIVGDKEVSEEKISVRSRSEGDLGQMAMEEFTSRILKEISERV